MGIFLAKMKKFETLSQIIDPKLILFTTRNEKTAVIQELTGTVASQAGISPTRMFDEIMSREAAFAPVIIPGLALPHAKLDVKRPWIAISVNRKGYRYSDEITEPVYLTVLLISPKDKPELHLNLLAGIVGAFSEEDAIKSLLETTDKASIASHFTDRT